MSKDMTHVGMDVDSRQIHVAVFGPEKRDPEEFKVTYDSKGIRGLVKKLQKKAVGEMLCCYEAGPTGYGLQRKLQAAGLACQVIAPSLIPQKPGERVKTDRRDARKLGELLRAEVLTEVYPPTEAQEAVRDLCRAREDAQQDLTRARHRLGKYLLRWDLRWTGKSTGTQAHRKWLRSLRFEHAAGQATLESYLATVEQREATLKSLIALIEEQSQGEAYREVVGALRCFRGIATITAMTLITEIHCFARFESARQFMAYLGLTPSEYSSGGRTQRGGITKAGNSHVRKALVEASKHQRHRPLVSEDLRRRREGQPASAIAIADVALERLHRRYKRLLHLGKHPNTATVAVGRELAGFIWAVVNSLPPRAA